MTLQIQVIVGVVLFTLGFGGGWYFNGLRGTAEIAREQRDSFQSLATAYAKQQSDDALKQKQLETESAQLKSDVLKYPDVNFSMCKFTPVLPAGGDQGQNIPSRARLVPQDPEPVSAVRGSNEGPIVFGLADAADKLTAKCRAL